MVFQDAHLAQQLSHQIRVARAFRKALELGLRLSENFFNHLLLRVQHFQTLYIELLRGFAACRVHVSCWTSATVLVLADNGGVDFNMVQNKARYTHIFLFASTCASFRSYSFIMRAFSDSRRLSFSKLNSCIFKRHVRDHNKIYTRLRQAVRKKQRIRTSSADIMISLAFSSASCLMNMTIWSICLFAYIHRQCVIYCGCTLTSSNTIIC